MNAIVLESSEAFLLNAKHEPRPCIENVRRALHGFGDCVRFETFAGRITCADIPPECGHFPDGEWTDEHTTSLVALCARAFNLYVSPSDVDRAVALHAHERAYNVLTDFALECAAAWDGTARVDQALATYWGARDTDATRIASRVLLLSLAARALEPGAKVDTCVTFVGAQGVYKSSGFRALVGAAWFSDSPLPIGDKDAMQNLRGKWLWEFSENESLSRKERNAVKAFLSSQADDYRASYGHHAKRVPRQTCFVASTNEPEFLTDPTGNRRFPIVAVGRIDLAAIDRDRVQLIGEAVARVQRGERHWPDAADDRVLDAVRAEHEEIDPWEEPIAKWLAEQKTREPFTIGAIMGTALLMSPERQDKRSQARIAAVLRGLGYVRRQARAGANRGKRVWEPRNQLGTRFGAGGGSTLRSIKKA